MNDYRKYSNVVKVEKGYFEYRLFLMLDCGHEVYRYSKSVPGKVLCEHCNRSAWFPRRQTKRAIDGAMVSPIERDWNGEEEDKAWAYLQKPPRD